MQIVYNRFIPTLRNGYDTFVQNCFAQERLAFRVKVFASSLLITAALYGIPSFRTFANSLERDLQNFTAYKIVAVSSWILLIGIVPVNIAAIAVRCIHYYAQLREKKLDQEFWLREQEPLKVKPFLPQREGCLGTLNLLPNEIIERIFDRLSPDDQLKFGLASRSCMHLVGAQPLIQKTRPGLLTFFSNQKFREAYSLLKILYIRAKQLNLPFQVNLSQKLIKTYILFSRKVTNREIGNEFLLSLLEVRIKDIGSCFMVRNLFILSLLDDRESIKVGLLKIVYQLRTGGKLPNNELERLIKEIPVENLLNFIERFIVTFRGFTNNLNYNLTFEALNCLTSISAKCGIEKVIPLNALHPQSCEVFTYSIRIWDSEKYEYNDFFMKDPGKEICSCFAEDPLLSTLFSKFSWPVFEQTPSTFREEMAFITDEMKGNRHLNAFAIKNLQNLSKKLADYNCTSHGEEIDRVTWTPEQLKECNLTINYMLKRRLTIQEAIQTSGRDQVEISMVKFD